MTNQAAYTIIDTQTGDTVCCFASRQCARRAADRLDLAYGAVRYSVKVIDTAEELDAERIADRRNAWASIAI